MSFNEVLKIGIFKKVVHAGEKKLPVVMQVLPKWTIYCTQITMDRKGRRKRITTIISIIFSCLVAKITQSERKSNVCVSVFVEIISKYVILLLYMSLSTCRCLLVKDSRSFKFL